MNSQLLFANNAQSKLASPITNTALSLTVTAGSGVLFPNPSITGQAFKLTLVDAATGLLNEIVLVTAVATDTFTIVRGQEGTTALNWLAGDNLANLFTRDTAAQWAQSGLPPVAIAGLTNTDITLNAYQSGGGLIVATGVLTGDVHLKFPDATPGVWRVQNKTTGAHNLFVKTVSGATSIGVPQDSNVYFVASNGTEMVPFGYLNGANLTTVQQVSLSGTNTYTGTITGLTSYTPLALLVISFANAPTAASTINLNSLGAISLFNAVGSDPTNFYNTFTEYLCQINSGGTAVNILGPMKAPSASIRTGTDINPFITPAGLLGAQGFTALAKSSSQTIVPGSSMSFSHGLGRAPLLGFMILTNISAEGNYTAGDIVVITPFVWNNGGTATNAYGWSFSVPNGSTTVCKFNISTQGINIIDNTGSAGEFPITPAKWGAVFCALG